MAIECFLIVVEGYLNNLLRLRSTNDAVAIQLQCAIEKGEEMANVLGIKGYHYVEFYVGSAKTTAYWFSKAFGMQLTGYCGPETGVRSQVSYYLTQNNLKIVVTSALQPSNFAVSGFINQHGDGVKRWSVEVKSVTQAFDYAVKNGGVPVLKPRKLEDSNGFVEEAAIKIFDDTELVFINDDQYSGVFKPGFRPIENSLPTNHEAPNLWGIDHIVGNVRENEMDQWSDYFIKALDFENTIHFGPGDISTQYSALLSKVVASKDGIIKNPINEPYHGVKVSQIEEYVNEYRGSGIQHIALITKDIISTIAALRKNGVEFLTIPDAYYVQLKERNSALTKDKKVTENLDQITDLGILCDLEGSGYLLQLFTKPIQDRPTFFFEIIQRRNGAKGFGQGNFQALFNAIEQEQANRGNLDR